MSATPPATQTITQNFARPSYRPPEPAGLDPDMRRMMIIAAALGGAGAVIVGLVSLRPAAHHGVPVIEASPLPVRVKPLNPGGMQVAGAEDLAEGQGEKLAPAAEKPAIHALRARRAAKAPRVIPAPTTVPIAAPARAVAPALPLPVALPLPAAAPVQGGTAVQLAAFETQQAAEQDWGKLAEKMPHLFDGRRPEVQQARVAGRIVYRLRTGGFANLAAATAFCGEVRSRGGDCSIAAF